MSEKNTVLFLCFFFSFLLIFFFEIERRREHKCSSKETPRYNERWNGDKIFAMGVFDETLPFIDLKDEKGDVILRVNKGFLPVEYHPHIDTLFNRHIKKPYVVKWFWENEYVLTKWILDEENNINIYRYAGGRRL